MLTKRQRFGDHDAGQCMQVGNVGYNLFQRKINVISPNAFTNETIGVENIENELIIGENEYYDNITDLTTSEPDGSEDFTERKINVTSPNAFTNETIGSRAF